MMRNQYVLRLFFDINFNITLSDHIFDEATKNRDVFDTVVRPIVDAAVNGFNGTVFAYGQTSSGKTFTMMGDLNEPGIITLAIEHMFDAIANTLRREFLLRFMLFLLNIEYNIYRVNKITNITKYLKIANKFKSIYLLFIECRILKFIMKKLMIS